VVAKVERPLDC